MHVSFGLGPAPAVHGAATFGNFDGVHLGHRALVAELRARARELGGPALVVTFEPHPLRVLRPDHAPPALDDLDARLQLLEQAGVDAALVLRFDRALSRKPARWFADTVLFSRARVVLAGYDARFGAGGHGDVQLLRRVAAERGGRVELFDALQMDGGVVSSSRIRNLVEAGGVAQAAALLGRPFALRAPIVHGDHLGRTLGFPTANLAVPHMRDRQLVRPAAGVYAARLLVGAKGLAGSLSLPAVCNLGERPTVGGKEWRVEAHALDWSGDLYGRLATLELLARIRPERRFPGLEALKAQIELDCAAARALL